MEEIAVNVNLEKENRKANDKSYKNAKKSVYVKSTQMAKRITSKVAVNIGINPSDLCTYYACVH